MLYSGRQKSIFIIIGLICINRIISEFCNSHNSSIDKQLVEAIMRKSVIAIIIICFIIVDFCLIFEKRNDQYVDEKTYPVEMSNYILDYFKETGFYNVRIFNEYNYGSYLLMQRDRCKQFGGMWEATAGGSALQNESPLDCAIRELQEETGIRTDNLVEVGPERSNDTIYLEIFCVTNCNKDCITLQDGETIAYKWVSRSELVSLKKSELVTERMQKFIEELQL